QAGEGQAGPLADFVDDDHRLQRWLAWIGLVELVYAVAINPMGGRDRQTGLVLGLVLVLALALALHRHLSRSGEESPSRLRSPWILPVLALVLWIQPARTSLSDLAATRSWAPHDWSREALARTPTDALVLTQSDDLSAGLAAARMLEGARPDVVAVVAQHLYRPATEWQLAEPRRASVWRAAATADPAGGDRARLVAVLERWRGPVVIESPATVVFAGLALPGEGEPPLWLSELPIPAGSLPPGARVPGEADPLAAAVARWRGRLEAPVDRERLAEEVRARRACDDRRRA
ncbi:MAG: hypothetical protein KC457_34880, partial [Myxococcales bacterium]|nr:hypothetical protein [Myxococcales bacterium]